MRQVKPSIGAVADVFVDPYRVMVRAQVTLACIAQQGQDGTLLTALKHLVGQGQHADKIGAGGWPHLAAQQAQALLPGSRVVGAFHHVSAVLLLDETVERIDTDVLVLGDDRAATDLVQVLVDRIPGMRGVFGGRLRNAHQVEALTANLISVNRRYKAHAGLRVTDV